MDLYCILLLVIGGLQFVILIFFNIFTILVAKNLDYKGAIHKLMGWNGQELP